MDNAEQPAQVRNCRRRLVIPPSIAARLGIEPVDVTWTIFGEVDAEITGEDRRFLRSAGIEP